MCGIAGILNHADDRVELRGVLERMQHALRHRGPDDEGLMIMPGGTTGFVHTRLSILDLSPAGHQPMSTADGRYTITFNGEIYNFRELRRQLEAAGTRFISQSDTEVILQLYAARGSDCVKELQGMFAFAIWDRVENTCFIARDPLGIKPLYFCERGTTLAFASEIRALVGAGVVANQLSRRALVGYLLYGSTPEPDCMVEGIHCLKAGHHLLWRDGRTTLTPYWQLEFPDASDPADAAWRTRGALMDSVRRHFVSDVPVSIFLSGGMDSTALLSLAQQLEHPDLRTFCISFDDPKFNEGDVAAQTANYFGAEHFDWRLDAATGKKLIHSYLAACDRPSIDGFNTYCVSKHARDNGAKVVLSGLGGDEMFGGYGSFTDIPKLMKYGRWAGHAGSARSIGRLLEEGVRRPRYRRLGQFLTGEHSISAAYWAMRGIFTPVEVESLCRIYTGTSLDSEIESAIHYEVPLQPTIEDEVSYLEMTRYMRNQLLRDSDVMSMAWGLELRVPFVDRRLVETLAGIPSGVRIQKSKGLLWQAVPEIPNWVANRKKRGFVFPFENWITDEWGDVFERLDKTSPVPLQTWYRRWSLFALESFLDGCHISSGRLASRS